MPNDIWETGHQRLHFSHRFCLFCECAKQYLLGLRQVSWTVACGPRLSLLGGPIALQCFVHISDKKPCNTKVVFNQPFWPWRICICGKPNIYESFPRDTIHSKYSISIIDVFLDFTKPTKPQHAAWITPPFLSFKNHISIGSIRFSPRLHVRHLGEAAKRPRRRRPRRPHRTCPPEILEVDRFPFQDFLKGLGIWWWWEFLRIFTETISLGLFHGVYGCVGKNGRIMVTIMWILPAVHDSWNWWRFARWFTNPHTWCKSKPSMKPLYRQRGAWKLMWNHCTKQCYLFASFHFLQFSALRWPEWFSNIFHLVNGCGAAGELGWILCHRGKTWDEWGLVRHNHQWDSKDHEWYPYHQAFMTHGTHGLWIFSLMEQRPWHRWSTHVNINGIPFCSHQK